MKSDGSIIGSVGSAAVYPTRRDPILVCPHCKRPVLEMLATNDGKLYDIYRCRDHGDVVAILSEVAND